MPPAIYKSVSAQDRSQETWSFVQRVRSAIRRQYTPEEKVRIVLQGFRQEGIKPYTNQTWIKTFTETGKEKLAR